MAEQPEPAPWPFQIVWLLLFVVPWVVSLRHVIKHREDDFHRVGSSKTKWLVLLLTLGTFAAVPYLFSTRRRINRVEGPPERP